jgi:hypothetical protein
MYDNAIIHAITAVRDVLRLPRGAGGLQLGV